MKWTKLDICGDENGNKIDMNQKTVYRGRNGLLFIFQIQKEFFLSIKYLRFHPTKWSKCILMKVVKLRFRKCIIFIILDRKSIMELLPDDLRFSKTKHQIRFHQNVKIE